MTSLLARLRERPEFGFLPVGALLLIVGLGLSRWAALRGTVDLHAGETADRLSDGRALPFQIRMDAMAVDAPEAPARLLVRRGDDEVAVDPVEGRTAQLGSTRFTVVKALPRAVPEIAFREREKGPENPVLHLLLGLGTPAPLEGYLIARDSARLRFDEPGGRFAVLFAERWDPAALEGLKARSGTLLFTVGGRTFTHAARPGNWAFPTFDLKIVDVFPDLGVRAGKNGAPQAFHQSRVPRNPWALLRLTQKGGQAADLLVAANPPQDPAYRAAFEAILPPGSDLRYDRTDEELMPRFLVLTPDGQARLVEEGRLVRTENLPIGRPFVVAKGLSVTVLERLAHGEMLTTYRPAKAGASATPALEVRVEDATRGLQEVRWLGLEGGDIEIPGADLHLRFGPPAPSLDTVRARIAVLDAGASPLAMRTLTGSETLTVKGHTLRLGRGASQAGRWARLSITRDPWGWLEILGAVLLGLGIVLLARRRGISTASSDD